MTKPAWWFSWRDEWRGYQMLTWPWWVPNPIILLFAKWYCPTCLHPRDKSHSWDVICDDCYYVMFK